MQSPQIENGYVKIANELMDAIIRYRFSGEERRIIDIIMRKTYGWNKKADVISLSQFNDMTGMKKPSIIRAINKLISKNIISKKATPIGNLYSFNKLFNTWQPLAKKLTVSNLANSVSKKANKSLAKKLHTKDNIKTLYTKDILLRNSKTYGNEDINHLLEYFKQIMEIPKEDCSQRQSRQYWSLLLKESKTGVNGVKWLIDLAKRDKFYSANITSSKDLYYTRVKLISRIRGKSPKIAVFGGDNNV